MLIHQVPREFTIGGIFLPPLLVFGILGGGWEIRDGQDPVDFLPVDMKQEMRDRTPAWEGVLQ